MPMDQRGNTAMNFKQLFEMGGYGIYIWTTYSITLLVFALNLFFSFQEKRRVKKIIQHYLKSS